MTWENPSRSSTTSMKPCTPALAFVCDDLSLVLEQEGSSLAVCATRITDRAREVARL
jgi:hypothetical protein